MLEFKVGMRVRVREDVEYYGGKVGRITKVKVYDAGKGYGGECEVHSDEFVEGLNRIRELPFGFNELEIVYIPAVDIKPRRKIKL